MGSNGLTNIQKQIAKAMLSYENISEYEISDVIIAFGHIMKKEDINIVKQIISRYSDEIHVSLNDYLYENNDIILELRYLLDSIKVIKNRSEKGTEERKIIRDELNKLKNLCNIYSAESIKDNKNDENEAYFKILSYLLIDDSNYNKIEELLKRRRKVCNLRYNDRHIVLYILDLYIVNLKQMIKDKNSDYIDPVYLRNVYYLFTKNPYCRLNQAERQEAQSIIRDMEHYVNNKLTSRKRKKKAKKELSSLKPVKYFRGSSILKDREYDDDYLAYLSITLANNVKYVMKDKEFEEAFLCHTRPYKIETKSDNSIKLTVYSINYGPVIAEKSMFQDYFEYCEFHKIKMDDFFHSSLNPKLGEMYPAIAYELTFFPSGKIKSLNVKQTNFKVVEENRTFRGTDNMLALNSLFKKSTVKNGGMYSSYDLSAWNKHFEDVLELEYVDFLHHAKLPFLYHGYSKINSELVERNMNELNSYFNSLSKKDSYEIAHILCSNTDRVHYSVLPMENAEYDLKLLDPISYLGIENQRMLNDLYFNCRKLESKERLHKLKLSTLYKYIDTVDELNDNLNYVGDTQKYSRGRIKNLVRL